MAAWTILVVDHQKNNSDELYILLLYENKSILNMLNILHQNMKTFK